VNCTAVSEPLAGPEGIDASLRLGIMGDLGEKRELPFEIADQVGVGEQSLDRTHGPGWSLGKPRCERSEAGLKRHCRADFRNQAEAQRLGCANAAAGEQQIEGRCAADYAP
jgi:hypothetical protein